MKKLNKGNAGFTLVELAIVMMIIGLLIGGILKGQELMENARVTATIAQIQAYEASTTSFRDVYNAFPGDMANALARVPNCTTGNGCQNGDGNSIVGTVGGIAAFNATLPAAAVAVTAESILYWRHMLLADLISGVSTTNTQLAWGETNPAAKMGGGYRIAHANGAAYGAGTPSGHFLILQNAVDAVPGLAAGDIGQAPVSPVRAEQIDRKMDDGRPGTGYVLGTGPTAAASGCYTAGAGGAPATYQGHTIKSCSLMFRIQG